MEIANCSKQLISKYRKREPKPKIQRSLKLPEKNSNFLLRIAKDIAQDTQLEK